MSDYRPQGSMIVPMTGEVLYLTGQGDRSHFHGTVTRIGYAFASWLPRHQPVAYNDLPPA